MPTRRGTTAVSSREDPRRVRRLVVAQSPPREEEAAVYHPDIRHEVTRRHYAELLEQARLERLAAVAEANPELGARFSRARGVIAGLQLRLDRAPLASRRPGLYSV
jgi:hypothetical protein